VGIAEKGLKFSGEVN
jgi:hypothetical protein